MTRSWTAILALAVVLCLLFAHSISALQFEPTIYNDVGDFTTQFMQTFKCNPPCSEDDISVVVIESSSKEFIDFKSLHVTAYKDGEPFFETDAIAFAPNSFHITYPEGFNVSDEIITLIGVIEFHIREPVTKELTVSFVHTQPGESYDPFQSKWLVVHGEPNTKGKLHLNASPLQSIYDGAAEGDLFFQIAVDLNEPMHGSNDHDSLHPPHIIHPFLKSASLYVTGHSSLHAEHAIPCSIDGAPVNVQSGPSLYHFTPMPAPKDTTPMEVSSRVGATYAKQLIFNCPIAFTPREQHEWGPTQDFFVYIEYNDNAPKDLPYLFSTKEPHMLPYQPIITPTSSYHPGLLFCVFDFNKAPDVNIVTTTVHVDGIDDPTAVSRGHFVLSTLSDPAQGVWSAIVRQPFKIEPTSTNGEPISLQLDPVNFKPGMPLRMTYEIAIAPEAIRQLASNTLSCRNTFSIPTGDDDTLSFESQSYSFIATLDDIVAKSTVGISHIKYKSKEDQTMTRFNMKLTLPDILNDAELISLNLPLYTPYNFNPKNRPEDAVNPERTFLVVPEKGVFKQGATVVVKTIDNIILDAAHQLTDQEQFFILVLAHAQKDGPVTHATTVAFNFKDSIVPDDDDDKDDDDDDNDGGDKKKSMKWLYFVIAAIGLIVLGGIIMLVYRWRRRAVEKRHAAPLLSINDGDDGSVYDQLS